jgi:hypothetical protein
VAGWCPVNRFFVMYRGYVKLWRKLEDSQIFQNEKALKIWIWILIKANHQKNTVLFGRQKINLDKGQFIMGLNKASEHLCLAKSTIHFWINYLKDLGQVELKKTNKYTIITILNWDDYQDTETQMELKKNSNGTQKETNKNGGYIIKNEKEIILNSGQSPQVQEILKIFYEINPTLNFGNTTQRKAADNLIKKIGVEKAVAFARAAVAVFGKQYAPTITTPLQLEQKLADLVCFYKKQQVNSLTNLEDIK